MSIEIVQDRTSESRILSILLIAVYISYGAIGRDIFFNSLQDPTAYDPIGAALNHVRLVVCIAIIATILSTCGLNATLRAIPLSFLPFTTLAVLSNYWSDGESTFRGSIVLLSLSIAFPLILQRLGLRRVANLLLHLIALVLISSVFMALALPSIGRHSGTEFMQFTHVGEWRGIFSHKNALGAWAGFGTVLLFTQRSLVGGVSLYWWFARCCALICLAFAHSITGVFAAIFMYGIWVLIKASAGNASRFATVSILVSIPTAVFMIFADDILSLFGRDMSLTGRTDIWVLAWHRILESPLVGYGYMGYGGNGFSELIQSITGQALGVDSAYFSLLIDVGFIGAIFFFIPILIGTFAAVARLNDFDPESRQALIMMLVITAGAFFMGITEASSFFDTGFDGIICYTGLMTMVTMSKIPKIGLLRQAWSERSAGPTFAVHT